MQPELNIVKIESEESAWEFLKKSLEDSFDGSDLQIIFENWPVIKIHIEKKGQDASLNSRNMEGLIELQKTINRSYSLIVYDTPNTLSLTNSDKQAVELFFKITEGTTGIEAALEKAIETITAKVSEKMEPKHFIGVVLSVALLWTGQSCWRTWLQTQKEMKQIEHETESRQFASKAEYQKMELIADLAKRVPQVQAVKENAEEMYNNVLKSVSDADSVSIAGINDISGKTVRALIKNEPVKSKEVRLDGAYRILKVDSSKNDSFKVNVRDTDTSETFTAVIKDSFVTLEKHKKILQNAEWNKTPVQLTINAKRTKGSVTSAIIIGVGEIEND